MTIESKDSQTTTELKEANMATDPKETKTTTAAASPKPAQSEVEAGPVYIDMRGKSGKKRRYSRDARDLQRAARPLNRGLERFTSAVAESATQWRKDWDRSAEKKRDGALKDAPENAARAIARVVRGTSWVPVDAAKALRQTRLYRQLVRALTRS
jgi:hypothetical protein